MVCQTGFDLFGGYDHDAGGGFVHVADWHIAPGKKQWTWGDHGFGHAWDRELTDTKGPYVELMGGVYTDNQPDFTYLNPYETKTFSQYWWPIQGIGPVQNATTAPWNSPRSIIWWDGRRMCSTCCCRDVSILGKADPGGRDVFIGEDGRRTAKDFAACLDHLANHVLPEADKIILVMDNLNTHKEASLYEAFPPEKARGLCERFEFHYPPKHGSWLNMAETRDRAAGPRLPGPADRLGERIPPRGHRLSRKEKREPKTYQLAVHQ